MSTVIRQLGPDEAAVFRALRLEALALHPEAFAASLQEEAALPLAAFAERLGRTAVFGGWLDDRLVGVAGFARPGPARKRHKGVLWGVYVQPSLSGRGLGRALVGRVIDHARTRVVQLHTTVVAGNEAACRLYRALGFRPYGFEPGGLRVGERHLDQELLVLVFDQARPTAQIPTGAAARILGP